MTAPLQEAALAPLPGSPAAAVADERPGDRDVGG